jgi:hypothetical protein
MKSPENIQDGETKKKEESFGSHIHHGSMNDVVSLMHESEDSLKQVLEMLPKPVEELYSLSKKNELTEETFFSLVRQSFRYLETIIDLEEEKRKGYGTEEYKNKDTARGRTHNATISSIDIWLRSLVKVGEDISFLDSIRANRMTYGLFAVGIALGTYVNKDIFPELTNNNI